jgi:tyrosyl-tRNA synthetase
MIGDPKPTEERPLLSVEEIERNAAAIKAQLARFLDFEIRPNPARLVNNADWLARFDLLGFLRDTGKYFTVNYLLQKEAVSRRLGNEEGISFTEFSYPLLQARDYLELFDQYQCTLQMGGSDQWGNITAGIDLIRKLRGKKAHGLVWPLMMTASGTKFGKTETGAIWLDPARTSPFKFYQFWLNTDDRDVVTYLKYFTFLEQPAIADLEAVARSAPESREAQRALAREVTTLVHGADEAARAVQGSERLFAGLSPDQSADDVLASLEDVPSTGVTASVLTEERPLAQWLVDAKLVTSKSEATRLIRSGGIYVNDVAVTDEKMRLGLKNLWQKKLIVLGKGKRQKHVLKLTE